MWTQIRKEGGGAGTVLLVIFTLVVIGGVAFLVLNSRSNQASGNDSAIAPLKAQIESLQSQLDAANSQIKSLQGQLTQANTDKSAAQGDVSAANLKIAALNEQISQLRKQIATMDYTISNLQSMVNGGNATIPGLQTQVDNLTKLLADANKQIDSLVNIPGIAKTTTVMDSNTISRPPGVVGPIYYMNAHFAGYLEISGTASSDGTYFEVKDSFPGYPYNLNSYSFGNGGKLIIPILPGDVTVYYDNLTAKTTVDATITIKYYY